MNGSPVLISLKTASASTAATFALGLFAAWAVARIRGRALRTALDALFTLPLVLPPTVAGYFLLCIFGVKRPVGRFLLEHLGVKIAFSWGATVLAAAVISFPLMYRSARGAFEQVDPVFVQAARTLGMSETTILRRVELPLAWPGVLSGGVLAFARGLGEFGATAMIAGNIAGRTRTLPLALYSAVAAGDMEGAGGYVGVLLAISLLAVGIVNLLPARRPGR